MIIIKIQGGLGNQMFQHALGRRLSLEWGDELKYDVSWFDNIKSDETHRNLEINNFNVVVNCATEDEIVCAKRGAVFWLFSKLIERIRGRINRNHFYRFYPGILKKKKYIYLDGYFQSYKYFETIRDVLLKDFILMKSFSTEALEFKDKIEQNDQSVSVHVRRGDYVSTCKDWNGLCGINYYKMGLGIISKNYLNLNIFIFSDDIEWAKANLKFDYPTTFVSKPSLSSVEELVLMSLCKHQIIANSTFSWWAAWLNKNPEKIVVSPKRWLAVAEIDTSDLLPKEWVKL